jgi:tetratricopeptide (TPR) repeat protein
LSEDDVKTATVASRAPARRPLPALERGTTVGRYVILDRLGHGGMGIVYRAFDPDLDRRVALKLVRAVSADTTARLIREGQALAKVSHPNIVQVFDVGVFGETVFIAMELVEGKTLTAWSKEAPRDWRETLGYLLDAGRGLAAAHDANLVHRDFKPQNVMIGADGRVRVLDFGVARRAVWIADPSAEPDDANADESEDGDEAGSDESTNPVASIAPAGLPRILPSRLTGTWGYMAPEQRTRGVLDARADQFAFAVTSWEMLHGERPFAGENPKQYAEASASGKFRPPPAGNLTPAWVRKVLLRALSPKPADRYGSMNDVIAALTADPARRRTEIAIGVMVIAAAVGVTAAIASLGSDSTLCEDGPRHMVGVWDPAVATQLDQAFRATGVTFAADTATKVSTALETRRGSWLAMHRDACRATRVSGDQSAQLLDLRMGCLARRREEMRALVQQLIASPDAPRVAASIEAVARLPAIASCADRDALTAVLPPPEDAMQRAEIAHARDELATINALFATGQWPDARTRAEQLQRRANRIAWPPLVAEAGLMRGLVERHAGSFAASEAALNEAAQAAARAHLDDVAATAWSELAWVVGYEEERPAEGLALTAAAEAAALRAGATPAELANVAHTRATIWSAKGEHAAALREAQRALAMLPADDLEAVDIRNTIGIIQSAQGNYAEAEAAHRDVLARRRAALGEGHPKVADSLDNLGVVRFHQGAYAEARKDYEQALALRIAVLGAGHRDVGTSHNNLGGLLMETGDVRGAAEHLEAALRIYESRLGPSHSSLAIPLSNLGELATRRGDFSQAIRYCNRALALDEATAPDDPQLAYDLVCVGEAHLGLGSFAAARTALERALQLRESAEGDAGELARTRFDLARALWRDGSAADRTRAQSLAASARDGFTAAGDAWKARRAEATAWLAAPR